VFACLIAGPVMAHVTPPVLLMSDREAVVGLLGGARRFFVREVTLTAEQRQAVAQRSGWSPDERFYRFYLGRDDQGRLVAALVFLTEYTVHGPVRVAVALAPDGKVRGAAVVELTEETYPWVKPLIDRNFTADYVGLDSRASFALKHAGVNDMAHFYGEVVASLIKRAALLYELALDPSSKT
jgi:Na+-translocating ferredoxin:NAD+ oxidoreductase RnfG subunit